MAYDGNTAPEPAFIEASEVQVTCQRLQGEGATPLTFDIGSLLLPSLLLIYTFILQYT